MSIYKKIDNSQRNIVKLINFDKESSAIKWIEKHQVEYKENLFIGEHIKDGYIVYYYS